MAMQLSNVFSMMQVQNADYQNAMNIRAGYAPAFAGPTGDLSTTFSMMQMRNNMFGAQCFPGQNIYWGGNQLLGPMMMGGGAPVMSPMYMNQMMQQCLQQQSPPSYYAPQGYRQPLWRTNSTTGLPRLSSSSAQPQGSGLPAFGPKIDAVPDGGASSDPDYAALRKFGRERGSLDGTFVTPQTSHQEDLTNMMRLNYLMERAGKDFVGQIDRASPEEKLLLQRGEEQIDKRIAELKSRGIEVRSSLPMQIAMTDKLWKEGKLNDDLGRSNARLNEIVEMSARSEANSFLKSGERLPSYTEQKYISESPFNPGRQVTVERHWYNLWRAEPESTYRPTSPS